MYIDTDTIFSMTQANQNFSAVARSVDRNGEAVVFKNNKPKYIVIDMENNDFLLDLSEDEKFDIVTRRVLKRYLPEEEVELNEEGEEIKKDEWFRE